MPHQLIERLEAADLSVLRVATEALAARIAGEENVRHVGVALSDGAVLLLVSLADEAAATHLATSLLDPWLATVAVSSHVRTVAEITLDLDPSPPDLDGPGRLAAFTVAASSSGMVWGLYAATWARSDAGGAETEGLPVWPTREQAARCIAGPWQDHLPRKIELEDYLDQWLTGMQEDGIVAVVHPTPTDPGVVVGPAALKELLAGDS